MSLLDGKVFMHNLQYYINLEQEKGDRTAGDRYEGKLPVANMTLLISDPDTNKEIIRIPGRDALFDFGMSKFPVYCIMALDSRNLIKDESEQIKENENVCARYGFSDSQKKEMSTFGNSAVVIKNVDKFIYRIKKAAEKQKIQVGYGMVRYYQGDNMLEHQSQVLEQHGTALFWKREKYKNQQEYRICLKTEIDDHMILDIGSIRDIAELFETQELLDGEFCVRWYSGATQQNEKLRNDGSS